MIASLDVASTPASAADRAVADVAVVLDVLRATSTIVAALDNGAAAVVPVREPDEALAAARVLGRDETLLCGERNSVAIPGFDLDNSPASFTRERVAGKILVMTTTNGTRALAAAAAGGAPVYCGALRNRSAVASVLRAATGSARLICAGGRGEPSFEDLLGAGALTDALVRQAPHLVLSDAARAAWDVFRANAERLEAAVAAGTHARALIAAGFAGDLPFCARLDASACVPRYATGRITAADY